MFNLGRHKQLLMQDRVSDLAPCAKSVSQSLERLAVGFYRRQTLELLA